MPKLPENVGGGRWAWDAVGTEQLWLFDANPANFFFFTILTWLSMLSATAALHQLQTSHKALDLGYILRWEGCCSFHLLGAPAPGSGGVPQLMHEEPKPQQSVLIFSVLLIIMRSKLVFGQTPQLRDSFYQRRLLPKKWVQGLQCCLPCQKIFYIHRNLDTYFVKPKTTKIHPWVIDSPHGHWYLCSEILWCCRLGCFNNLTLKELRGKKWKR